MLTQVLEHLFGITATEAKIKEVCALEGLVLDKVDQGSTDLQELAARYKGQMKLAKGIAGGLAIVAPVVIWLSGANPGVVLAVVFAGVLIVAVVALLGMDYADWAGFCSSCAASARSQRACAPPCEGRREHDG